MPRMVDQRDHLDANYRRARRTGDLGSSRALSTIVHASGCAPLLLYVLLYRTDVYLPGQLDRILIDFALSTRQLLGDRHPQCCDLHGRKSARSIPASYALSFLASVP